MRRLARPVSAPLSGREAAPLARQRRSSAQRLIALVALVAACTPEARAPSDLVVASTTDAAAPVTTPSVDPPPRVSAPPPAEIGCATTAERLLDNEAQLRCIEPCTDGATVWGTDVYTVDSGICAAAIHAGVIPASGGTLVLTIVSGLAHYSGSRRNGVETHSWGTYERSFVVRAVDAHGQAIGEVPTIPEHPADCALTGSGALRRGAARARITCPPGCGQDEAWGTDVYTDDSSVCTAAMHAGIVGAGGGEVQVIAEPGAPAYNGTTRSGITTASWGPWTGSFRVSR